MSNRAMTNAERLHVAELTSSIDKAKGELDRINHGQLFNRAISERASKKISDLEEERSEFVSRFPGRLGRAS